MADKTIIYYYSGSGNSLSVAKHIGEKLGNTTLLSIYTLRDNPEVPQEYTRIGIVTATWFVRPPRIVKEVCEKLQCSRQQKIFILATCGGYDGFVCIDLKAILQPKTDFAVQTFMLPMPPNHIVGFSPMPDWINRIYLNHEAKASVRIAGKIKSDAPTKNRKGINRKFLNWVSATFNKKLLGVDRDSVEGGFYTSDACTKCGVCEKLCKNGNIKLDDDGPVWGHDCQQCMACIMWCPNHAIRHPNVPENRRRYQNPNVTLNDMMQSEFHIEKKKRRRTGKGWELNDIPNLSGKVMIVTGANSGLGFDTTRVLSKRGAKVVMACRNPEKANAAKEKILAKNSKADLEIMHLDLASQKSVADFADRFRQKYNRLDVLVNNAGIMAAPYSETVDGFENHFATNYLGHFALTGRLLDLLEATPGARVVSVSSLAYFFGNKIDFNNLYYKNKKGYGRWRAYGRSKMEMLLFAYELQRRLKRNGKSTISLAAHPGIAQTNIMPAQANNDFTKKFLTFVASFLKPTIYGAMPLIRAATDENVRGGEYFGPSKGRRPDVVKSNKASHNLNTAKKLWEASEALTGLHYLD